MLSPSSGSVAVMGLPMFSPAAVFSRTLSAVSALESITGGSFTSLTVMVTSMLLSYTVSGLPTMLLLSLTNTATW